MNKGEQAIESLRQLGAEACRSGFHSLEEIYKYYCKNLPRKRKKQFKKEFDNLLKWLIHE